MPVCNCESYGCNGEDVTPRTLESHQREDKRRYFRQAYSKATQVCDKQNDDIAVYISSLTLSDNATGSNSSPGGRLWSRSVQDDNIAAHLSSLTLSDDATAAGRHRLRASSRYSPINDALSELVSIEEELVSLISVGGRQSKSITTPLSRDDPFPLQSTLSTARLLRNRLSSINNRASSVRETKATISDRLNTFLAELTNCNTSWNKAMKRLPEAKETIPTYRTTHHFEATLPNVDPIIQVSLFTMVALQVVLHVSRRGCHFLLSMLRYIIQLSMTHNRRNISPHNEEFVANIPVDPDTASKKFALDGKDTIFAVCPNTKCHKTYPPSFHQDSSIPVYPKFCIFKEFPGGSECGTRLTHSHVTANVSVEVPIKKFVSFSFKDFVAGILSRPAFEDYMDCPRISPAGDDMRDIFDGQFLRDFKGPDGQPFHSTDKVGRYSFSLCLDFFNPFTNKQAGKKSSIGIISVVCLNLPPSLRYKPENMFLAGVIPGPNEPPLTAVNHYLTPLIDEFQTFWDTGIRFSQTHDHPDGRLVECALVLVICDLLAARKTAGFAACSHEHFCSVCHCTRSQQGYGNTDYHNWKRRTNTDCRNAAESYLNATTPESRLDKFNKAGVRWSELLRLPYFDIACCVVVDSMHNLFLGLIKEHFSGILGITPAPYRENAVVSLNLGTLSPDLSENDAKGVEKLKRWLEAPVAATFSPDRLKAVEKLKSVNLKSLNFVCTQMQCALPIKTTSYTKTDYANALLEWRLMQVENRETGADTSTQHGHVLTAEDMTEIWADLESILTPTWMTSVPHNLGNAAHGKLKADQWRTLGTIHLPLSLIRLWGNVDGDDPRSVRCRKILEVTMSLVSAVIIATSHNISTAHADSYLMHMIAYLNGIKELFPEYKLHPNHHMALHIHEYLLLFGPVHSWWTFPFERMIGALQRMPHNNKMGELEEAIARAYTRSANLRAILLKTECPDAIRHCEPIFRKLVDPQLRDSLQTDIQCLAALVHNDEDVQTVATKIMSLFPTELQLAFQRSQIDAPASGHFVSNFSIHGLMFSTFSHHHGNACVLLRATNDATPIPAEVAHIVEVSMEGTSKTYLAVRRHKPAPLHHDPFSRYPALRARLWQTPIPDLEVVMPSQILSHCARLPIKIGQEKYFAVLSLCRNV